MAARINAAHKSQTREKIQTSQLVNRLQDNAMGKVELTPVQVRSIEVLLKKSLPDLSAIEHTGEDGGPLKMVVTWKKSK